MVDKISFQMLYDELYRRSKYNEACCQNCMNDRKQIAQELSQKHQQIQKDVFAQKAKNCCEASRHVKDEIPKDINEQPKPPERTINTTARRGMNITTYPHWTNNIETVEKMLGLFGGYSGSLPPGTEIYIESTANGVNPYIQMAQEMFKKTSDDPFCPKHMTSWFDCECDE